jgi:hypothetical protein
MILISGCLSESASPAYKYNIEINGLDKYSNENSTEILVPVPVIDEMPLFNKTSINSTSGDWSITLLDTELGKMLSLKTNKSNLTNISVEYNDWILRNRSSSQYMDIIKRAMNAPLYPISNETSDNYSIYKPQEGNIFALQKNYTSYVIIDNNIKPIIGKNNSIEVMLKYDLFGGLDRGTSGGLYEVEIHEHIPEGEYGQIPVKVWVLSS